MKHTGINRRHRFDAAHHIRSSFASGVGRVEHGEVASFAQPLEHALEYSRASRVCTALSLFGAKKSAS
jgi:hypothetical protein